MTATDTTASATTAASDTVGAGDTASEIAGRIRAMLAKDFKIDPERLTDDARLEALGVDSIGMAEVIFNVEDAFNLKLPDSAVQLETFGDVVRYIDTALTAQRQGAAAGDAGAAIDTLPVPPPDA